MKQGLKLLILFLSTFSFAQNNDVNFSVEKKGSAYQIFADNDEYAPVTARFEFKLVNMTSSLKNGEYIIFEARNQKQLVAELKPINLQKSFSLNYDVVYNIGDASKKDHDDDYVYSLPFKAGKSFRVDQGYSGSFSHQNIKALDFNLKTGDEVYSAREGTVIDVVSHNTQSCPTINCAKFNNKIVVLHSDGSFADYSHLKKGGALVKKGDQISKSQLIGYSGSTGYASGPHLHFGVYFPKLDGTRTTIATKFKTSSSNAEFLEQGKSYTRN